MRHSVLRASLVVVLVSALGLHAYTVVMAYQLVEPGLTRYAATLAAFWFFPISEAVVAYYAWGASGSRINAYSVWIFLWALLALAVALLTASERRRDRARQVATRDTGSGPQS